jgi:hypothetical protein
MYLECTSIYVVDDENRLKRLSLKTCLLHLQKHKADIYIKSNFC